MMTETILNIEQASDLLLISPYAVRKLARQGKIPGCKVGREWRFIKLDLIEHIRSQSNDQKQDQEIICSTSAKVRRTGGLKSSRTDEQYKNLLGLKTERKPKSTTIN